MFKTKNQNEVCMTNIEPVVYCFRSDLRLADNAALTAAVETGLPLVLCYVFDDTPQNPWARGSASRWWLHHSLTSLMSGLEKLDAKLILRRQEWAQGVAEVAKTVNASSVFFSRSYDPYSANQEVTLKQHLDAKGVTTKRYGGYLFFEPEHVKTLNGEPYKVFTPFGNAALNNLVQGYPITDQNN